YLAKLEQGLMVGGVDFSSRGKQLPGLGQESLEVEGGPELIHGSGAVC
ncbi:MAG: hypothetical protein HGA54_07315, partial [Actinobacteria bacterium]|nr:hypothetical protein [Actinomycetota bacterium]